MLREGGMTLPIQRAPDARSNAFEPAEPRGSTSRSTRRRKRRIESFERLAEVFHAVLSEQTLDVLLERIADELVELIPHDSLTIYRANEAERLLVPVLARDPWADQIMKTRNAFGEGITGWAVEQQEPVLANQAHLDPRVKTVPGTPADEEEALICVPLVARGSVKGALNIYRLGKSAFSEFEFQLARRFADAAALALDNADNTAALEHQAQTDALTGLFNHRVFHERLAQELVVAGAEAVNVAVLMFDLDDFKHLNDAHGHGAGDALLKLVAGAVRSVTRAHDVPCRLGGEEFAILLPRSDAGDASIVASRLQEEFGRRIKSETGLELTASFGIAQAPEHSRRAQELAAFADAAMLSAKASGKDRIAIFDDSSRKRIAGEAKRRRDIRSVAHMKLLQSLSAKLSRLNELPDIGAAIVRELLTLIDYHACRVYVRDGDVLNPIAHRHEFAATDGRTIHALPLGIDEGVTGRAATTGRSVLVENALECEFAQQVPGTDAVPESMIATPLLFGGEVIGVTTITKLGVAQFDEDDVRLLEVLAGHAAVAVKNASLYEAERREAERARVLLAKSHSLLRLSHELVEAKEISEVASRAALHTVSILGCRTATVWLQDHSEEMLRLAGHYGLSKDQENAVAALELPPDRIRAVERGAKPFVISKLEAAASAGSVATASAYAIAPLRLPEGRRGCLVAGIDTESLPEDDLKLLAGIADHVQLAITNAAHFASVEAVFLSTIESLANALEASDEYTSSHARAIREMARAVGAAAGLDQETLKRLELAALFHDIGKIGIPNEILSKPGALTRQERELLQRHPEIGERILAPIAQLAEIGRIVRHCHERYDGLGYPDGLKGEAIPVESRIVFLCDAYHAMTSDRPYRARMSELAAKRELLTHSGTQFDPQFTPIFLHHIGRARQDGLDVELQALTGTTRPSQTG
jgi:diguanylate cyclase (GGDEF)-like protein